MTLLLLVGCGATWTIPDPLGVADSVPVDSSPPTPPAPPVCVNEVMPDNDASLADETGAYSDWIELHNPTAYPVSLEGWTLGDDRDEAGTALDAALTVPGFGYRLLWADGDPALGAYHLPFRLDADGGEVVLTAPDGGVAILAWGEVAGDFSVARVPDCCDPDTCLAFVWRGTPGATNGQPSR